MPHSESKISMRPLCLDLLFKHVDFIHAKCLTKCQSQLGMVRPSPGSQFLVYQSCHHVFNGFWKLQQVIGGGQNSRLKNALNSLDFDIGLLEIVPGHKHAGLWEHPKLYGCWHAHSMGVSIGFDSVKTQQDIGASQQKGWDGSQESY